LDTFEIVSNDTISVNSVFDFEIPDLGIGTHSVRSGIVLNNSFTQSNDIFEFSVFPPIPPYTSHDIDNVYHDLHTDLKRGKAVLLEFFASYSPDCKSIASILNKVWGDYGNGNDKFQIYSMSAFYYDDTTTLQELDWGNNFPVFAYSDYNKVLWNIFNIDNEENIIPVSMIICPDTIDPGFSPISWKTIGYTSTFENDLDNAIKECIGKPDAVKTSPVSILSIYPNPVKDMISISFSLKENLNVKVFITDMNGRTVKILSEYMVKYSEKISSGISELNSGTYFLNISTEKGVSSQKFIKI
jgi:thiol-disulfide isomerase/thioredoxin